MSSSSTPGPRVAGRSAPGARKRPSSLGVAALGVVALSVLAAPLYGPARAAPGGEGSMTGRDTTHDDTTGRDTTPDPPARQERCDLMENEFVRSIATADGGRIIYVSGPVLFVCEDGTRIEADSAVQYTATGFRELIGSVEIDGPDTRMTAERVHTSAETGRTEAWGRVRMEEKGAETRMVGDTLVFLEAGEFRDRDVLRMRGDRPYAVIRMEGDPAPDTTTPPEERPERVYIGMAEPEEPEEPVDTTPEPPPAPDTVFGDRLYMQGQSRFQAAGSVVVRRPDLEATGDSLDYDRALSRALLLGRDSVPARIDGQEFDLIGRTLRLLIQGSRIGEIRADGDARLTGRDVRIDAPRIRMFLDDGEIDRLSALGTDAGDGATPGDSAAVPSRAEAFAEDFHLRADSIEVRAPGQRMDRVVAVGRARGEALGRDSLTGPAAPEMLRRDWIEGDTVTAHFLPPDSVEGAGDDASGPSADSTGARSRLDRLVAVGGARSLYRIVRRDSVGTRSADTVAGEPDTAATGDGSHPADSIAADTSGASGAEAAGDSAAVDERLAVHYVVGDRITIVLRRGEVQHMEVDGRTRGLYLEPRSPGAVPAAPAVSDTTPRTPVVEDADTAGSGAGVGTEGRFP